MINLKKNGFKICSLAASVGLVLSVSTMSVNAQEAEVIDEDIETIEVRGAYSRNLQDALQNKRNSDSIVDGISANSMGTFPDLNLGESLQRITGVQINRSNSNPNNSPRDASINLRGLPDDFSRTLINGLPFADPVDEGGTSFGVFQSDLFSGLEVMKSPTASTPAGGLSGVINLKTSKPLDLKDGATTIGVKGTYESLTESTNPSGFLSTTQHINDDLGVTFAVVASQDNYRRDTTLVTRYSQLNDASGNPVTMADGGNVYYPGQARQIVSSYDGNNLGVSTALQYKLSDKVETQLSILYSGRDMDRPFDIWVVSDQGSTTNVEALSDPVFAGNNASGDPEYVVTDVRLTNVDTTQGPRPGSMKDEVLNINWAWNWMLDNWNIDAAIAHSRGKNETRTIQYDYRYGGENGLVADLFTGGADWKGFSMDVTDGAGVGFADVGDLGNVLGDYVASPPHVLEAPAAIGGYNRIIIADTDSDIETDMNVLSVNAKRYLDFGAVNGLEIGALYTDGTEESMRQRHTVLGIDNLSSEFINNDFVNDVHYLGGASFMGGELSTLNNWTSIDPSVLESRLQPVTVPEGYALGTAGWVINPFDGAVLNGNYEAKTKSTDVYAKLLFDGVISGFEYRGNFGARYVDYTTDLQSLRNNNGVIEQISTTNDYDDLLPSANVAINLNEDLILRLAYSNTIVRPLNRDNSPAQTVSVSTDTTNPNPISATLGNSNLEPYSANSYDMSLEWYNRPGGAITVALFKKEIDGFITSVNLCPADGGGLPFSSLTGTGVLDSEGVFDCYTPDGTGIIVSQQQNTADTIDVTGAELSIQQNLDFLDGFWSGFGGLFNFTFIDVSGQINGTDAVLAGVSERNYNAVVFYEADSYAIRFAYNWRDEYQMAAGGTFSGAARSVDARGQLDASASYNLTENAVLTFEAFNLTEEPLVEFEGNMNRPRRTDFDGRTVIVGARYAF